MRVFQSSYNDRSGKLRKTKTWYIEFRDHLQTMRRIPGMNDRKQAEALGHRIESLVSLKVAGQTLPPDMTKWIETLSSRLHRVLGKYGLLDANKVAALRPLLEHVDGGFDSPGWRQYLIAKGNTPDYIELACGRVKRVIKGCKCVYWSEISATRILACLNDLRADRKDTKDKVKRGISAQTFNFYLTAVKSFCRWMVKDGRATESPVDHLDGLNVKTDRRHDRRALSVEELQ